MRIPRLIVMGLLLCFIGLPQISPAAPIESAYPYAFRDNEGGYDPVGTGKGDNFTFGVIYVRPDANSGTTATATNPSASDPLPLWSLAYQGRPGTFAYELPFADAQLAGWLSPWEVTVANGDNTAVRYTPDRTTAEKMELVGNLSITGPAMSPTITWELPTTGATVNNVSFMLFNNDTNTIVSGESSIPLRATAVSVTLSGLAPGTNYAIRIMPEERDPARNNTVSRSSNWLGWEAKEGAAEGRVLELTAGSPAGVAQHVDTPANTFTVEFDYRFTTTTGFLQVYLDETLIGTTIEAPASLSDDYWRAVFKVDDPLLLNLENATLSFILDGPTGSNILIDNILFPGLQNPDFSSGLANWTTTGEGQATIIATPEPATLLLLANGLLGIMLYHRKFHKPRT